MRILFVTARCYPHLGGIETHVQEVGPRLAGLGHEIEVLTTDPGRHFPPEDAVRGMRIRRVPAYPAQRDYYLSPWIFSEIVRGSWDLVHIQGWATFVAPAALLAAKMRGLPVVLTFHSGGHSSGIRNAVRGLQRALLRPLIRRAGALIGVSDFEADFFARTMNIPRERFTVVPNGAETPAPSRGVSVDPDLIVSVGRLERYKGHHRAIEAMPHLLRRVPGARLRIVGAGPYEEALRRLVARHALQGRVTIEAIPGSERQRLADLLASSGLFVLFSEYEAHPVALMEAISVGRPALVSHTTGLAEVADKGLCRSLPLTAGPEMTAACMIEGLRTQRVAREIALPNWDDCTQALLRVYHAVLDARAASGVEMAPAMPST
ncbi:glycosyltransferase [Methylobacterium sp. NI91]|nr:MULTISPECIES: glycosyltransferase family 4 protein [unclassified Methylobacterium]QIJ73322.1 glycosyltransferase [Methylobacterium sp. CLZ]QIJ78226.1 glycosyltransferase [Methylobacterium sp. NI91]